MLINDWKLSKLSWQVVEILEEVQLELLVLGNTVNNEFRTLLNHDCVVSFESYCS